MIESREHTHFLVACRASGVMGENRADLRHRLADQHSRHDRPIGKMAEKEMLVDGIIFDPADLFLAMNLQDTIHQQEWVTVRDMLKNSINVQHRDQAPFQPSEGGAPTASPNVAPKSKALAVAAAKA